MSCTPRILVSVLLALTPLVAAAEEAPLTLGECVRRALEQGFTLRAESRTVDIARDAILDAKSDFDPRLSVSTSTSAAEISTDTPQTRNTSTRSSIGLSQRFALGTDATLSTNLNRSDIDPATASLNPAYSSDATLSLRQPLLKGFGTRVNRAFIRRAEIGSENAERDYAARTLDLIQSTETAYYVLSGAREQLGVLQASLSLAEKLLEEARARNVAGMSTSLDVLQAEVGVANARRGVLDATNVVDDSTDTLKALMGPMDPNETLGPTRPGSMEEGGSPSAEVSYTTALIRQPEYLAARAAIDLATVDIELAGNDLEPSLDLDVALGLNGNERSGTKAWSNAFAMDDTEWQAGLSITYPLGRRGEKARYRQAESHLTRQHILLEQLAQDILLDVRGAVRDIETGRESVRISAQAAELARKQHDAEMTRFKAGLSTSRRVLEAQTDLQSSRVAHARAQLDLSIARSVLRRIEGSSADRYGVDLAP